MEPVAEPAPAAFAAAAVLRRVRRGNAFEDTVERLLQTVKLGLYGFGERLPPERELSVRLGVGRETLRDALRALAQAGYVESRRGRFGGTFVTYRPAAAALGRVRELTRGMAADLDDALVIRGVLEVGAAESAAGRSISDRARAYLCTRLADTHAADLGVYRRADSRLHLAVAELTESASLVAAVADARMRINDLLDAIPLLKRNIAHSNAQHDAIVAAILAGDPGRARQHMQDHLAATSALLRGFLS